jgi:hypothetical protein
MICRGEIGERLLVITVSESEVTEETDGGTHSQAEKLRCSHIICSELNDMPFMKRVIAL